MQYRSCMVTGSDVKRARGRLHLTQMQLADLLGVSRRTVAEWEASGGLSQTIVGRLSVVFADSEPATTGVAPLESVSDLELVAEMARRLSSLRSQIDAAQAVRSETCPQSDEPTGTGHRSDSRNLQSGVDDAVYPGDAASSGTVGTEFYDDHADGSPRFTDRPGAC